MNKFARLPIIAVVFIGIFYFTYWPLLTIIFSIHPAAFLPPDEPHWIPTIAAILCSAFCAGFAAYYVWKRLKPSSTASPLYILDGALIIGSVAFCIGFFGGPTIFFPGSNQGPLLGIFITGPLGFILGGLGGLIYWLVKGKKEPSIGMDADPGTS